jgi:hypothetical protein
MPFQQYDTSKLRWDRPKPGRQSLFTGGYFTDLAVVNHKGHILQMRDFDPQINNDPTMKYFMVGSFHGKDDRRYTILADPDNNYTLVTTVYGHYNQVHSSVDPALTWENWHYWDLLTIPFTMGDMEYLRGDFQNVLNHRLLQ